MIPHPIKTSSSVENAKKGRNQGGNLEKELNKNRQKDERYRNGGNMKNWRSQFKEWLKEIIPWDKIEDYVQFEGDYPKDWEFKQGPISVHTKRTCYADRIGVLFFTKDNRYQIGAKENYLGCIVSSRKERAGEWWTRGSDLPDGKFSRKTWEAIKNRIIGYELVKVMKPQRSMPDVSE